MKNFLTGSWPLAFFVIFGKEPPTYFQWCPRYMPLKFMAEILLFRNSFFFTSDRNWPDIRLTYLPEGNYFWVMGTKAKKHSRALPLTPRPGSILSFPKFIRPGVKAETPHSAWVCQLVTGYHLPCIPYVYIN